MMRHPVLTLPDIDGLVPSEEEHRESLKADWSMSFATSSLGSKFSLFSTPPPKAFEKMDIPEVKPLVFVTEGTVKAERRVALLMETPIYGQHEYNQRLAERKERSVEPLIFEDIPPDEEDRTFTARHSGDWSDPSNWEGGGGPGASTLPDYGCRWIAIPVDPDIKPLVFEEEP